MDKPFVYDKYVTGKCFVGRKMDCNILGNLLEKGEHVTVDTMAASLEKDEISLLVAILQKPEILKRSEQSLRDYIDKIKDRKRIRSGKADLNDLQKPYFV